ncbi:MAG: methyltransferase domain-containing protein [Verrucomicrobiota bacterium]
MPHLNNVSQFVPKSDSLIAIACSHPANGQTFLFSARDYISDDSFKIVRCHTCGLTVTTPQPQDWSQYYPVAYYGGQGGNRFPKPVELLQNALYSSRARKVEEINEGCKGRVLDIGCGRGLLLKQFKQRGWEVHGTELDDKSAKFAREVLGLPIKTGELLDMQFPDEHFDAVVMWHVLEHVPVVSTLMSEISRILKPGGIFLVGVPNFGSIEARFAKAGWFHLDVPRHLNHFTKTTLRQNLSSAGFATKDFSHFAPEYDSFSFVQSTLNRLGLRHNLLYNFLRGQKAKVLGGKNSSPFQLILTLILAAPLGVLSFFFTTLAGLMQQGATITIFARKESAKSKSVERV